MNEQPASLRIWVALDESPRSAAALTAAAALAAELDAELAGLFVEDIDLQHLIGLPFAREFSVLTGAGRPLSQTDMERTWRREAETMQRLLAEAAGRLRLRWSFRVARGRVFAEVNTLAQAFDLIVLGKRTGFGVVSVAKTPARMTGLRPQVGPVLVLFDDRSDTFPSLDLGARLARRNDAELVLLINAGNRDEFEAACAVAQTALKARRIAGRCAWLTGINGASLIQTVRHEEASCLVLANKERYLTQAGFNRMLDELECPIVLTR
jgi:nucleotide-binding universal stress UspA family protein